MTFKLGFGEAGKPYTVTLKDSKGNPVDPTSYIDVAKSNLYILSPSKVDILLTVTSSNFTHLAGVITYTPTAIQSEAVPPGTYSGEFWARNTGETIRERFRFPVFIEKTVESILP